MTHIGGGQRLGAGHWPTANLVADGWPEG